MGEMSADAVDRISELPPFIIHQIMSKLSPNEVAQTSILSKTWKRLHASFPILDFDQTYFVGEDVTHLNFGDWRDRFKRDSKIFRKRLRKFMRFVDNSLLRFSRLNLCLQKFRLFTGLLDYKESPALVDRWITLVLELGVKEFDIKVLTDGEAEYTVPPIIFSANFVTVVKLVGCKLEQPSGTLRFHSLKTLTLERVCMIEQMLQKLVSECPLLEDLCISDCKGLKHVYISNAPKLKSMSINSEADEVENIQIMVAGLQKFSLNWKWKPRPLSIDLADCPCLKMLELMGINFTDEEFYRFISNFSLLEDLRLICCDLLERIIISSNQFRSLELSSCRLLEMVTISSNQLTTLVIRCLKNLKTLEVDTPNLLSFIYKKNPIPTFSLNVPCPWKVSFGYVSVVEFFNGWCLDVRKFLGASRKIEVLSISVTEDLSSSLNLEELSESWRRLPAFLVGNLHLDVEVAPSDYKILLDGLLCLFNPKTLTVATLDKPQHELFKWLYDELKNRDVNCCNSQHIKCWRHYLKDAGIESFCEYEDFKIFDRDNLMKLLHADIDNLMEMDVWSLLPKGELKFHLGWC